MSEEEIGRIIATTRPPVVDEESEEVIKTSIRHKVGDRVRVKEGYFQNYEGDVSKIDERNGRIEVMINIFGRSESSGTGSLAGRGPLRQMAGVKLTQANVD